MLTYDQYTMSLLEQGKRFLEKAKIDTTTEGKAAYLSASLLISVCFLEATINSIAVDFKDRSEFSVHEKALLLEKKVVLDNGIFIQTDKLQMYRLTEKIELLLRKFLYKKDYKKEKWWSELKQGILLRNALTHTKDINELDCKKVKITLESIIVCVDVLFKAVYKKSFPRKKKGLDSQYDF